MLSDIKKIERAAAELGREGVLNDPSNDEVLIASAELADVSTDLDTLTAGQRHLINCAYNNGHVYSFAASRCD